ncbi:MAG TPA: DUF4258 domain-containing protein [Polyangiaceae bacterium]|nr:DUF4258 domain-containing protein [Polyangiaceae bacterium]
MTILIVVTPAEVLATAKQAAELRRICLSAHAFKRIQERGVHLADLDSAIKTATHAEWSEEHSSWTLSGGVDFDGDPLRVAVSIEGAKVTIVTVIGD